MARAILHIGTEKTGTTSIQSYLYSNKKTLAAGGYIYPKAAGDQNHIKLAVYGAEDGRVDDLRRSLNISNLADLKSFRLHFAQKLQAEIQSSPNCTFIFSNEHCHSRLTESTEIARLHGLLAPLFDSMLVVVYLRRQDELAVSKYSTVLKEGGTKKDIIDPLMASDPYYDYSALLSRWAGVFGKDNLSVNLFEKGSLCGDSILEDFCKKTGVPLLDRSDNRKNESLTPQYQEFLRKMNEKLPTNVARTGLGETLTRVGGGKGRLPSRKDSQHFYELFQESNEKVRAAFFPERATLFSEDFSHYPEEETLCELGLEDVLAITARMCLDQLEEIRLLQAENCYLGGRVDHLLGKLEGADRKFRMAIQLQPLQAKTWYFLARTLLETGRSGEALEANKRALELDPENEMFARLDVKLRKQNANKPKG